MNEQAKSDNRPESAEEKMSRRSASTKYIANFPNLCELVEHDGQVKFLTFHGNLETEYSYNGQVFYPPQKDRLAFEILPYAQIEKYLTDVSDVSPDVSLDDIEANLIDTDVSDVYQTPRTDIRESGHRLFNKIKSFHEESAELPDPRFSILTTAWCIHTHLLEKFEYSPIIFFGGLPEKGKSRMAKAMTYVAKRGLIKASVTDAQIIREASDHNATIFFDMTDFWESITASGSKDVVLSRFERGLKVARVLNPEKGAFADMTYFNVFGPTIIASNEAIEQVLGSRTIPIVMRQSRRLFNKGVSLDTAKELQAELVAFRLITHNTELEDTTKIVTGRFGDIIRPLHQIIRTFAQEYEQDFIDLINEIEKKKLMAKSNTIEGEIVSAILTLGPLVQYGYIPVKAITDKLNEDKNERDKLTYQKVGRKLDLMGYEKGRTATGASSIRWSSSLNEVLAVEHDLFKKEEEGQVGVYNVSNTSNENATLKNGNDVSLETSVMPSNIYDTTISIFTEDK